MNGLRSEAGGGDPGAGFRAVASFGTGYRNPSELISRLFNLALALFLIVLVSPLFVLIGVILLLREGRPLFYSGVRLGRHKQPFIMYKFRTLVPDAQKIVGAQLLTDSHKLITRSGRFLRDTRLDELPQLYNILRGEMDFVGPRPERPEIYEHICRHILHYDKRFAVKPGLIGFSQLFTPHGAPKRIRTMIDNRLVARKQRFMGDLSIVAMTGMMVIGSVFERGFKYLKSEFWNSRCLRRYAQKRLSERVEQDSALVRYGHRVDQWEGEAQLVDINGRAFLMRSDKPLSDPLPCVFELETSYRGRNGVLRRRQARCKGEIIRVQHDGASRHDYVFTYDPLTALQYYSVHQYFLKESIA